MIQIRTSLIFFGQKSYQMLLEITQSPAILAKKAQMAKSTKISMTPIQDLHGYDNPWPAGGGKNKFNIETLDVSPITVSSGVATGTSGNFNSVFGPNASPIYTNNSSDRISISLMAKTDGNQSTSGNGIIIVFEYTDETSATVISIPNNTSAYTRFTATSNASKTLKDIHISYSASGQNIWYIKEMQIELSNQSTSYVPYSNICPISGRSSVEINGCGKNRFDKSATFNEHNGYILNDSGVQVSSIASGYTDPVTEVFPNTTYILTGELTEYNAADTANGFRVYYYTADGEFIGRSANLRPSTAVPFSSFTTPSNCRMLAYQWQFTHNYPQLNTIQLELGSEASTYEPYAESNDVTITFPAVGKNKFNIGNIPASGAVKNNGDGSLEITTGSGSSGVPVTGQKKLSEVVPDLVVGKTYYINATSTGSHKYVYCGSRWDFGSTKTITQTELDSTLYFYASGVNTVATISDFIICESTESDKSYEPYTNTVYGGTLDVETGVLTVDKKGVKISDLSIFRSNNGGNWPHYLFYANLSDRKRASTGICDVYKFITSTEAQVLDDCFILPSWNTYMYIRDDSIDNVADFMTNRGDYHIVYELATPITIQLTPSQIQILKGQNTIWIEDEGVTIALTYKN